jgi:hypothetical protein
MTMLKLSHARISHGKNLDLKGFAGISIFTTLSYQHMISKFSSVLLASVKVSVGPYTVTT